MISVQLAVHDVFPAKTAPILLSFFPSFFLSHNMCQSAYAKVRNTVALNDKLAIHFRPAADDSICCISRLQSPAPV